MVSLWKIFLWVMIFHCTFAGICTETAAHQPDSDDIYLSESGKEDLDSIDVAQTIDIDDIEPIEPFDETVIDEVNDYGQLEEEDDTPLPSLFEN